MNKRAFRYMCLLGILILGLGAFTGCQSSTENPIENPGGVDPILYQNGTWTLVGYTVDDYVNAPPAQNAPTITFSPEGKVNGTAACNSYFGEYGFDDETLRMSSMGMTEMWCEGEGIMDLQTLFIQRLQAANSLAMDGDILVLSDGVNEMRFSMNAPSFSFGGTNWLLDSYQVDGAAMPSNRHTLVALYFTPDQVKGYAGCNWIGAQYTLTSDQVTFDGMEMTARACLGDGVMEQESVISTILSGANTYRYEGEALVLEGSSGSVRLRPLGYPVGYPFAGTSWQLKEIRLDGLPVEEINSLAGLTLVFDENTQGVSGSSGCNQFSGTYTLDGLSIQFGPLMGTMMACDVGVMQLESRYLGYLQSARQVVFEQNRLTIIHDDGLLVFE